MQRRNNLSVFFYLEELTAKIVAQSGIPSDRFHMGKIILQSLKNNLDLVSQIDGARDQYETNRSVLERSVRCALSFRSMGLQRGDVMIIMAPNHVDVAIPVYAAAYLGIAISGIDMHLGVRELESTFTIQKPKIVFCQTDKSSNVETALNKSNNATHIITFDEGSKFCSFSDLLKKGNDGSRVEDFKPTDFNAEETTGILLSTSGSTGLPKAADLTHKNFMMALPHWISRFNNFPTPTRLNLFLSPLQWLTASVQFISSPIFQYTRLQTSSPTTKEHVYDLINKYKPTCAGLGPSLLATMQATDKDSCDFSCLEVVLSGGSYISQKLIDNLKSLAPQVSIDRVYGLSEIGGLAAAYEDEDPIESIGKPIGHLRHRHNSGLARHRQVVISVLNSSVKPQTAEEIAMSLHHLLPELDVKMQRRNNLSVFFFLEELTAKIVAQSGIPSDRFHMGKIILQSLKNNLDLVAQIDGARDQYETNRSVLERSVRCAISFRSMGLQRGDVMIIMAPNHVDLAIPFYAATYLGIAIAGIDINLGVRELESTFAIHKPKIVFCQTNKSADIETALKKSNNGTHIITFDEGSKFCCFSDLLKKGNDGSRVEDFTPTDFNAEETTGILLSTSGSTGLPKAAELTHKNFMRALPHWLARFNNFPTPSRLVFFVSPVQWLTATVQNIGSPIFQYSRLQSSGPPTKEHFVDLINKYKPTCTLMGPSTLAALLLATGSDGKKCDLTSMKVVYVGGSYIPQSLIDNLKSVAPQVEVDRVYGMSEIGGLAVAYEDDAPIDSIGKPSGHLKHRLVDPTTLKDIDEPDVAGELWLKGPSVFKGYYNDPETTKACFSKDGWYMTGDLLKRDSSNYLYYVDRLKTLLKYNNHQVSPIELEGVIRQHPAVQEVVVIGIPDAECGELPAACVVVNPGATVTAQEIKDIVKENLTDTKQLRGGVFFVNEIPMTSTDKIDRPRTKKMAIEMRRE